MRDTGWVGNIRRFRTAEFRTSIMLRTWDTVDGFELFGHVSERDDHAPSETARRAAEDALRSLCRDVLAALGDGR